ncbi:hypothetical protein WR25_06068 [Diploscapter pachys]|uniref:Uncharacterized protein n=1 Tax=Diploscapter pachys TaxID=2018661 RepID=A0A2A2LNN6_9BILA|nr:hypothetical protein WR25_06068 [Diploscapter pachys]
MIPSLRSTPHTFFHLAKMLHRSVNFINYDHEKKKNKEITGTALLPSKSKSLFSPNKYASGLAMSNRPPHIRKCEPKRGKSGLLGIGIVVLRLSVPPSERSTQAQPAHSTAHLAHILVQIDRFLEKIDDTEPDGSAKSINGYFI